MLGSEIVINHTRFPIISYVVILLRPVLSRLKLLANNDQTSYNTLSPKKQSTDANPDLCIQNALNFRFPPSQTRLVRRSALCASAGADEPGRALQLTYNTKNITWFKRVTRHSCNNSFIVTLPCRGIEVWWVGWVRRRRTMPFVDCVVE